MAVMHLLSPAIRAAEQGRVPDTLVRAGIRRLLASRRQHLLSGGCEMREQRREAFISACRDEPIAAGPEKANEQHYELPAAFFSTVLGGRLKYSCCYWDQHTGSLDEAEEAALAQTCERAGVADGQSILELGCGWGSLSLWMARRYPACQITAVSNSRWQRDHILRQAEKKRITNLTVLTEDINSFAPQETFDRVLSVEMFEHVRNHGELMRRISTWLNPEGRLLVHLFCHREVPYFFEPRDESDWMARHFFTGGVMPDDHLLSRYQSHLRLTSHWRWSGLHYAQTANAWLAKLDRHRAALQPLFDQTYGSEAGLRWLGRWRIFFMACAELFAFRGGDEWWVSHYLFEKQG